MAAYVLLVELSRSDLVVVAASIGLVALALLAF
jgi:hypothetical protein